MRVVVLGAGYAGLTVARRLERQLPNDVELLVVDESDVHLVQHELHRVVRRPETADTITVPLEDVLGRATVRQARVTDLDTSSREVTLVDVESGDSGTLRYDYAAVCLGAETEHYDLPGVEEHALPLKRLHHATAIRDAVVAAADGDVVVGGAGLSGVQVAAEVNALSDERDLDVDVTLLEMSDRITPQFHETFGDAVRRELEAQGVIVRTGATVAGADDRVVHLGDGDAVPYDAFVWTGGLRGPSALGGERPAVDGDLEVDDGTFVVGDAGTVTDDEGRHVPASAQTAVREAKVAAANIAAGVRQSRPVDRTGDETGDETSEERPTDDGYPDSYHFDVPGWIVSVADTAVAQLGPVVLTGEPAKLAKAAVGAGHLGSVGEVERASRLVHDELGWPAGRAVDLPAGVIERYSLTSSTDPGTPSDFEYPLSVLDDVLNAFSSDDPLDLTTVTRVVDRDSPGSAADLAGRTVLDGMNAAMRVALGNGASASDDDANAGASDDDAEELDVSAGDAGDTDRNVGNDRDD